MSFGKMPQPWYKVSGYFFDNDINPEGIAARFGDRPVLRQRVRHVAVGAQHARATRPCSAGSSA